MESKSLLSYFIKKEKIWQIQTEHLNHVLRPFQYGMRSLRRRIVVYKKKYNNIKLFLSIGFGLFAFLEKTSFAFLEKEQQQMYNI